MTTVTCDQCGRRLTNEEHLFRHRQSHFIGRERVEDALERRAVALTKLADSNDEYLWSLESETNRRTFLEDRQRRLEEDIRRRRARIYSGYQTFSKAEDSASGRQELAALADDGVRLAHIQNELRRLRKRPNEDTSGRTPGVGRAG